MTLLRSPANARPPARAPRGDLEIARADALAVFSRGPRRPDATPPNAFLERALGVRATTRYWHVLRDLAVRAAEPE